MLSQGVLQDALESLFLEDQNWEIAKIYFYRHRKDNEEILEQVVPQDFALLTQNQREACLDHCGQIQWQVQEMKMRYVKFVAAVGGASSCYVLVRNNNIGWCLKWFSKKQTMAIRTEMYAHTTETLQQGCLSVLYGLVKPDPEVWYQAMDLCRGQDDAPRMLMEAVYLYCLTIKKIEGEHKDEVREDLLQRLLEQLVQMFGTKVLSESEAARLQEFVLTAVRTEKIPEDIYGILSGKKCSKYMLTLLSGCAFLALGHGTPFETLLRLLAVIDRESGHPDMLNILRYMVDRMWFYQHLNFLMERLPIERGLWVNWSFRSQEKTIWAMVMRQYPEEVKEAVGKMDLWDYEDTMRQIKGMNPALHQEIEDLYAGEYLPKVAEELVTNFDIYEDEAKRYLLGELSLTEIFPLVKDWRKTGSGYYGNKMVRLSILREDPKHQEMYRRAVVMEAILLHGTYFVHYLYTSQSYKEWDKQRIEHMLSIFQKEQVPLSYQLDLLACMYDEIYYEEIQNIFQKECIAALTEHLEEWGEEYQKIALQGAARARIFCICVLHQYPEKYKETLLACACDSSKQVHELLTALYAGHKEWEADVVSMLDSKKQKVRQTAMEVLVKWGVSQYEDVLTKALSTEKNAKLAERLRRMLHVGDETDIEKIIANVLKGGRRQKVAWAFEKPYPALHWLDGTEAPKEYLQAIMVSYAVMSEPGIQKEALILADKLQKAELNVCMTGLFLRWLQSGAEAKKKWVLYAASVHGGQEIIPLLHQQIKELPARSRGAMAVEAVRALSLNGSSEALLLVDQISRKCKYRQVKKAAAEALEYAAGELGISRDELEDRIVPDLGFDSRAEQIFDYGKRSFTIRLMPSLELEVYTDQGKRLKNMPAPGKQDEEEKAKEAYNAYKLMKKQLKTVLDSQKLRMEQALLEGRLWTVENWKALFLKNPLMHPFAAGLVWGVYEQGALKDAFRYMEDGTCNTADEEEYLLPEDGKIGLAHPVELSDDSLKAWKEQFADYEILQPIGQLDRKVYGLLEDELAKSKFTRFEEAEFNGLAFSSNLIARGWQRGPIGDHGEYDLLYREDKGIRTELKFSGCTVIFDNRKAVLYDLTFYQPQENKTSCLLGEVAPRYFSEVICQIVKAEPMVLLVCDTH